MPGALHPPGRPPTPPICAGSASMHASRRGRPSGSCRPSSRDTSPRGGRVRRPHWRRHCWMHRRRGAGWNFTFWSVLSWRRRCRRKIPARPRWWAGWTWSGWWRCASGPCWPARAGRQAGACSAPAALRLRPLPRRLAAAQAAAATCRAAAAGGAAAGAQHCGCQPAPREREHLQSMGAGAGEGTGTYTSTRCSAVASAQQSVVPSACSSQIGITVHFTTPSTSPFPHAAACYSVLQPIV